MQTSIIIRNAMPRDRYIKAQSSTREPFLECFDIAHVGHKFPKIESEGREWLKRRLGKAISQRRQYLRYCREHHDKFSQRIEQDQPNAENLSQNKDPLGDLALSVDASHISGSQQEAGTL